MSVDEIFASHSINEIRLISNKMSADIERKKQDLRLMVGERYRDLVSAADTIHEMKNTFISVQSLLLNVKDTSTSVASSVKVPVFEPKQDYSVAAQLKILIDAPEQIWNALESLDYCRASRIFLLSRQIHKNLSNDKRFPVVTRQWNAIAHFKSQIIDAATSSLSQHSNISNALSALQLLNTLNRKESLEFFLSQRLGLVKNSFKYFDVHAIQAHISHTLDVLPTFTQEITLDKITFDGHIFRYLPTTLLLPPYLDKEPLPQSVLDEEKEKWIHDVLQVFNDIFPQVLSKITSGKEIHVLLRDADGVSAETTRHLAYHRANELLKTQLNDLRTVWLGILQDGTTGFYDKWETLKTDYMDCFKSGSYKCNELSKLYEDLVLQTIHDLKTQVMTLENTLTSTQITIIAKTARKVGIEAVKYTHLFHAQLKSQELTLRKRYKETDSRVLELQKVMMDIYLSCFTVWVNDLASKISLDTLQGDMSCSPVISGVWEGISLQNVASPILPVSGYDTTPGGEKVLLPIYPTKPLIASLLFCCKQINDATEYQIEKGLIAILQERLCVAYVKIYEDLIDKMDLSDPTTESKIQSGLNDKWIIQIYFDILYLSKVFEYAYLKQRSRFDTLLSMVKSKIDPIDYAVFSDPLSQNAERFYTRIVLSYGSLLILNTKRNEKKGFATEDTYHVTTVSQVPTRFVVFPLNEEGYASGNSPSSQIPTINVNPAGTKERTRVPLKLNRNYQNYNSGTNSLKQQLERSLAQLAPDTGSSSQVRAGKELMNVATSLFSGIFRG